MLKDTRSFGEAPKYRRPDAPIGWCDRGPAGAAALLGLKPTTLEPRIKALWLQRPR